MGAIISPWWPQPHQQQKLAIMILLPYLTIKNFVVSIFIFLLFYPLIFVKDMNESLETSFSIKKTSTKNQW